MLLHLLFQKFCPAPTSISQIVYRWQLDSVRGQTKITKWLYWLTTLFFFLPCPPSEFALHAGPAFERNLPPRQARIASTSTNGGRIVWFRNGAFVLYCRSNGDREIRNCSRYSTRSRRGDCQRRRVSNLLRPRLAYSKTGPIYTGESASSPDRHYSPIGRNECGEIPAWSDVRDSRNSFARQARNRGGRKRTLH